MALTNPDWLTQHGGSLKQASDGKTWFVMLNHEPQYALTAVPVGGKFGCLIQQTINGRRLESPGTYENAENALRSGLEDLRKVLGW